jgi:hypothetical protein
MFQTEKCKRMQVDLVTVVSTHNFMFMCTAVVVLLNKFCWLCHAYASAAPVCRHYAKPFYIRLCTICLLVQEVLKNTILISLYKMPDGARGKKGKGKGVPVLN